jgi:hypothetical protein
MISHIALDSLVHQYQTDQAKRLTTLRDCMNSLPDLESAIKRSTIRSNGKPYRHQNNCGKNRMLKAQAILLSEESTLRGFNSFDDLHRIVHSLIEMPHIGDLAIYDISLRLGMYLNLLPEEVYLHCGTTEGAKALGLSVRKRTTITVDELPTELAVLSCMELEDFLCLFAGHFEGHPAGSACNSLSHCDAIRECKEEEC